MKKKRKKTHNDSDTCVIAGFTKSATRLKFQFVAILIENLYRHSVARKTTIIQLLSLFFFSRYAVANRPKGFIRVECKQNSKQKYNVTGCYHVF